MAPKTNNTPKTNKKKRKVLNIAQKLEIVNLLENGEKVAAVARKFEVNESTIRTIRDNADNTKMLPLTIFEKNHKIYKNDVDEIFFVYKIRY